jgi:hypothetical protein
VKDKYVTGTEPSTCDPIRRAGQRDNLYFQVEKNSLPAFTARNGVVLWLCHFLSPLKLEKYASLLHFHGEWSAVSQAPILETNHDGFI